MENLSDFMKDMYENPANQDDIENKNQKYIYNYEDKGKIVEIKITRMGWIVSFVWLCYTTR